MGTRTSPLSIRLQALICLAAILWSAGLLAADTTALGSDTKALVGGTLIDGFGGEPIRNSVILIEGETHRRGGSGRHPAGAGTGAR